MGEKEGEVRSANMFTDLPVIVRPEGLELSLEDNWKKEQNEVKRKVQDEGKKLKKIKSKRPKNPNLRRVMNWTWTVAYPKSKIVFFLVILTMVRTVGRQTLK